MALVEDRTLVISFSTENGNVVNLNFIKFNNWILEVRVGFAVSIVSQRGLRINDSDSLQKLRQERKQINHGASHYCKSREDHIVVRCVTLAPRAPREAGRPARSVINNEVPCINFVGDARLRAYRPRISD